MRYGLVCTKINGDVSSCCLSFANDNQYELFATSAADSTVKIWDLRARKSVQLLSGHTNRGVQPVGIALSPCLRYAASGSEDRAVYMFDLRMGSFLHRYGVILVQLFIAGLVVTVMLYLMLHLIHVTLS